MATLSHFPVSPAEAERTARIEALLPLVAPIAKSLKAKFPPSFDLADMEQIGVMGLIAAVDNCRASRLDTLAAYARVKIRGAILDKCTGKGYRESTRPELEDRHYELASGDEHPDNVIDIGRKRAAIAAAVEQLTPRQKQVMAMRYEAEMTQAATGRAIGGISQAGARDLEKRAVAAIQRAVLVMPKRSESQPGKPRRGFHEFRPMRRAA
jgi:RNA polymerase sigma factor (sigma-70 family)